MKIEGDYRFLPLSNGGCAIVDADKYELVKDMRWTWCHRGVGCNHKDQLILLHSMIAPYEKVSFKNGYKWDCRKENLIKCVSTRKGANIFDYKSEKCFDIHRKVTSGGQKYVCCYKVFYGQKRTKEEAYKKACSVRDEILSMSREEFISFLKSRPSKKIKYSNIIADWDCWKDRGEGVSNAEMYQMNINHHYDPNLRK